MSTTKQKVQELKEKMKKAMVHSILDKVYRPDGTARSRDEVERLLGVAKRIGVLRLEKAGDRKIEVIKTIRTHLDISLKDAIGVVERTPTTLGFLPKSKARSLKLALEQAGAAVSM
jgi:ribosomal protein L7/L12